MAGASRLLVGTKAGVEGDNVGGVFWREDGPSPEWHFVCEWPVNDKAPDIRGFAAVPHPRGFGYDVALVTLESFGKVYCIDPIGGDPRNGHIVTEELNIQSFLGDEWNGGASIGFPTLSAYNDMPEVIHPGTGQPVNLIGLGVGYPAPNNTPERNSAYYLIRHRDARYEWAQVIDPAEPLPNPEAGGLRATRGICLSPFPEDAGRVLYYCGFDAASRAGPVYHNTAWIYRGVLADAPVCPDEGDTHVTGLAIEGPAGNGPGTYTATAAAIDDSDDPIEYLFTADDGAGTVLEAGPQAEETATFALTARTWTIAVAVDDDPACNDVAPDARRAVSIAVNELASFRRGDANAEGAVDIADAICALGYLFGADDDPCKELVPRCLDAADANDDGAVNIADAIKTLSHLFAHSGPLPPPFGECGIDPTTDALDCSSYPHCVGR